MSRLIRWILGTAAIAPFVVGAFVLDASTAQADAAAGRAALKRNECNSCHSVSVDGIEVIENDDDDLDFEDDFGDEEEEREPPDLSGVANRHERDWMEKWLHKKIKNDDGFTHKKKFKGTPEELADILDYLTSLKEDAPPNASED